MPTIQNKRGTSSGLSSANPLLLDGEIVIESDTNKLKVGNGVYYWNELNYLNANTSGINIVNSSGNFTSLTLNGTGVSVSGHTHTASNITNFNSSVSGLFPANLVTGSGVTNHIPYWSSTSGLLADSSQLIWDNTNNRLGIGTSTPSGAIDAVGDVYIRGATNTTGVLYLKSGGLSDTSCKLRTDTNGNLFLDAGPYVKCGNQDGRLDMYATSQWVTIGNNYDAGTANQYVRFIPANTEMMRVTKNGVSIGGVVSPLDRIHISGTQTTIRINNGIGYDTQLRMIDTVSDWSVGINQGNSVGSGFFNIRSNTAGANRLTIDTSGNVGIGITTPSMKLQVAGNASIGYTGENVDRSLTIYSSNVANKGMVLTNIAGNSYIRYNIGNQNLYVGDSTYRWLNIENYVVANGGGAYKVFTTGTSIPNFIINNSGYVGIGTITPSSELHVIGSGLFSGNVTANDSFIGGSGTASLPSLEFINDTDTGLFSPAANTFAISTSGVERLRVNNVGNIGIGTTTPSGQLHVIGTGIFSSSVGIGTNTPTYDLDVRTNSTNALYVTQGAGARYLLFGPNGFINNTTLAVSKTAWSSLASLEVNTVISSRRGLVIEQVASQTANAIETRDIASNVLSYISSSGGAYFANNLGIGTTTPTSRLHVIGSGLFSGDVTASGSFIGGSGTASLPSFEFTGDPDTGLFSPSANTFGISTSGVERLRVNNIGNIGIGTTSPSSKLHVLGDLIIDSNTETNTRLILNNDGSQVADFTWDWTNQKLDITTLQLNINTENGLVVETDSPIQLNPNGGGNVGIGTSSPGSKLTVSGTESVFAVIGNDLTYGGQPPTINLKGYTWFGSNDGTVGIGANTNSAGAFGSSTDFFTFTGFNENVTTYTPICLCAGYDPQLFLNTDLNVGIGTATPYSKLHVNGSLSVATDTSEVSSGNEGIIFGTDGSIYAFDSGPGALFSLDQTNGLRIYGDGGTGNAVILSTDRGFARIGIGTVTPDATLHVAGNVHIEGSLQSAGEMLYLWSNFR